MNIIVQEIGTTPNSTASQLFIDGRAFCFVIEDGYREKKVPGETRIPPGRYEIEKGFSGSFYAKYKAKFSHEFSLYVRNVPGFEGIMIHIGNTVKDSRGCLLVNRFVGIDQGTGDYLGSDSTTVYKLLYELIKKAFERGEEVWIDIMRMKTIKVLQQNA